jgi:hypothetical protein
VCPNKDIKYVFSFLCAEGANTYACVVFGKEGEGRESERKGRYMSSRDVVHTHVYY